MNILKAEQFELLLKAAPIKPRFKRDIKFVASVEGLRDDDWRERELLPIWNKSRNGGILLVQPDDDLYLVAFEANKTTASSGGSIKPIICDFCYTWRSGPDGGFITFYLDKSSNDSLSLLCCMDLLCSLHVRTKTSAALKSRAQLREDMNNDDRIERLRRKLREFEAKNDLSPAF